MTDSAQSPDLLVFEDPSKKTIPSTLYILTVLTYIGCGLGFIGAVVQVFILKAFETVNHSMSQSHLYKQPLTPVDKSNMEVSVIAVISTACCFMGAWMMRKLQRKGFWLYVIGEFMPLIASLILLGKFSFMNLGWLSLFNYFAMLLFVLLYSSQFKYLVKG